MTKKIKKTLIFSFIFLFGLMAALFIGTILPCISPVKADETNFTDMLIKSYDFSKEADRELVQGHSECGSEISFNGSKLFLDMGTVGQYNQMRHYFIKIADFDTFKDLNKITFDFICKFSDLNCMTDTSKIWRYTYGIYTFVDGGSINCVSGESSSTVLADCKIDGKDSYVISITESIISGIENQYNYSKENISGFEDNQFEVYFCFSINVSSEIYPVITVENFRDIRNARRRNYGYSVRYGNNGYRRQNVLRPLSKNTRNSKNIDIRSRDCRTENRERSGKNRR